MTDRDAFAAAALTGLLSNVQRYQNGPLVRQAFEIADFMLRERGAAFRDNCVTGNKPEIGCPQPLLTDAKPVAWMVQNDEGERWLCHNHPAAAKYGLRCVPLFAKPQPTLTDEEREARTGGT
jgi:hypothetical protein